MKYIQLRRYFHPWGPFAFWRWLPCNIENALNVNIDDIVFKMCVHLEYKETSLHKIIPENISKGNHWINTLFIYMDVPVDDDNSPNFYNMNPPVEIINKIATAIRKFESTLYGIVRNEIGQFWLPNSHEIDKLDDLEILLNIEIKNLNNKWVQFCGGGIFGKSSIPKPDNQITEKRWKEMKPLLESEYKSDLSLVFFRNAQFYLDKDNYRLAIVECCIALERAISIFLPDLIPNHLIETLNPYLNKQSLTEKVENLLPILIDDIEIKETDIEKCVKAVNLRNQIIHRSCVNINKIDAEDALSYVKKVLDKLIGRKFEIIEEIPWKKNNNKEKR